MFLISRDSRSFKVFEFFLGELDVQANDIFRYELRNGYELIWTSIKTIDNLTVFKDGFVVGKTDFHQQYSLNPFEQKDEFVPHELHPLLLSSMIRTTENGLEVQPGEQMSIYYSTDNVSDFSILISLLENKVPSLEAVGMLSATGYFLGNVTLFPGIQKISYLSRLVLPENKEFQHSSFSPKKNDDDLMVKRFLEVIPEKIDTAISLSGGMDSRFVLGLLFKKGYKPNVYSRVCDEEDIIKEICDKTGLSVKFTNFPEMNDYTYTVRTDARIYHRGGNYYRMINDVKTDEFIFNGLSAEPALKHVDKSVWKNPFVLKKNVVNRIINLGYLGDVKEKIDGLLIEKKQLRLFYQECINPINQRLNVEKKHEITRFFDHFNCSMNLTHAHTADLAYFRYPIFLLAEKGAVEWGLRSPLYLGLNDDRLRRLNLKLTPQFPIDYSSGRLFKERPFIINDIYKLYIEYVQRFIVFIRYVRNRRKGTAKKYLKPEAKLSFITNPGFLNYFDRDLANLQASSDVTGNVKRAAITVNNVLKLHHKFKEFSKVF